MPITLSPETQRLIEDRMKAGGYRTADDVVRASLASLDQTLKNGDFEPGELDELLAQGEASGPPLDGGEVLRELRDLRARPR